MWLSKAEKAKLKAAVARRKAAAARRKAESEAEWTAEPNRLKRVFQTNT